jgi:hypothetical protein
MMRRQWMDSKKRSHASVLLLGIFACAGCGSAKLNDMGSEEGSAVASIVEELNEIKGNDQQIAAVYVNANSAPKSDEMNRYAFYVIGKPTVENSKAKAKVRVENNDGTPVGEFEWTFDQAGGTWKVENAPLR